MLRLMWAPASRVVRIGSLCFQAGGRKKTLNLAFVLCLCQRAFTKKLPDMNSLTYRERLSLLRLESLELRRLKADLIMFFLNFKGFYQH